MRSGRYGLSEEPRTKYVLHNIKPGYSIKAHDYPERRHRPTPRPPDTTTEIGRCTQMRKICAWCNKFMGNIGRADETAGLITHSICDECADNLDFQLGVTLHRYLDSLKMPIALVDGDAKVILANSGVRESAATEPLQLDGKWKEKIYECPHARLPQRCDNDIHCSGCTIR